MLKSYFKDLYNSVFKQSKIKKVLFILITILLIAITFISFYKLDYIITTPGYLGNSAGTVGVDTKNSSGDINFVTVISYDRPSIIQYLTSLNDEKVLIEKVEKGYDYDKDLPISITSKWISINKAIIYAYDKAKEVDSEIHLVKNFMGVIVYFLTDEAQTNLKSEDIITEIEGIKITSLQHLQEVYKEKVLEKKEGDKIYFKVRSIESDTLNDRYAIIYKDEDSNLKIGLYLDEYYNLDGENSNPKFKINYRENIDSSGNSGGAMLTLSIYNRLINEDITKGKKICGTGTIESDGTIGRIGAIEQKVVKAYVNKVDYFFVDSYDYESCVNQAKKLGYEQEFIDKIISVEKFEDILETLKDG